MARKEKKSTKMYSERISPGVLKLYKDNPDPNLELRDDFNEIRRELEEIEKALIRPPKTPQFSSCA